MAMLNYQRVTVVTDIFAMTVVMIDNDCYKESLLFQYIPTIVEIDRNYGVINPYFWGNKTPLQSIPPCN